MGAELIQEYDLFLLDSVTTQVLQQPWNNPLIGRRSGEVGECDTNATVRPEPFSQRLYTDRRIESCQDRRPLIGQSRLVFRLDDLDLRVAQLDVEISFSVCQRDLQRILIVLRDGISRTLSAIATFLPAHNE